MIKADLIKKASIKTVQGMMTTALTSRVITKRDIQSQALTEMVMTDKGMIISVITARATTEKENMTDSLTLMLLQAVT